MTLSRITRLALAGLVAACSSPTGTETVLGDVYTLQSIAGVALPAPYAPNPSVPDVMVSSTLALNDDGTGTWQSVIDGDGDPYDQTSEFTWTRTGNRVSITLRCPPTASCIAGPHLVGDLAGDALTVQSSPVIRTPLVFAAAPGAGVATIAR